MKVYCETVNMEQLNASLAIVLNNCYSTEQLKETSQYGSVSLHSLLKF